VKNSTRRGGESFRPHPSRSGSRLLKAASLSPREASLLFRWHPYAELPVPQRSGSALPAHNHGPRTP
jgi:hypothetical protein